VKDDGGVVDADETAIADRHAVGIAAEIAIDVLDAKEGPFCVDDPALFVEPGASPSCSAIGAFISEQAADAQALQAGEELAAEERAEHVDGEEKVLGRSHPARAGGVDRSVIALWLGHEAMETTQIYLHADIRLKENALARTTSSGVGPPRYRPKDDVLAFLECL